MAEAEVQTQVEKGFRIDFASRLPDLSTAVSNAYLADYGGDKNSLFALSTKPAYPHRAGTLELLRLKRLTNSLMIHDSFIVYEPASKAERLAIVLERPEGGSLANRTLTEAQVVDVIIKPIILALRDHHERAIVHRGVRPSNIFMKKGQVLLGPCVAEPPGMLQPIEYEPMERGVAMPVGRGEGFPACDLYALGVTALHFLTGGNELSGKSDMECYSFKTLLGSYRALVGRRQIGLAIDHFLRGTLCDNADDRWTIADIENWLDGRTRRVSDKPVELATPEPFMFGGTQFRNPPLLALAFAKRADLAIETLKSKTIIPWAKTNIDDDWVAGGVASSYQHFAFDGANKDQKNAYFLMLMCLALAHNGTLYYRNVITNLDGLGYVIAHAFETNNDDMVKALTEVILPDIFNHWTACVTRYGQASSESKRVIQAIESTKNTMETGRRIVKLLYSLNRDQRCLSPAAAAGFVTSADRVLEALETKAEEYTSNADVLDYHIACFLRYRDSYLEKTIQSLEMLKPTDELFATMLVELLAYLHAQAGGNFVKLSAYLVKQAERLSNKFRSKSRREEVMKAVMVAANRGDVSGINAAINAPDVDRQDYSKFRAAFNRYKALEARAKASPTIFSVREQELFEKFAEFQTLVALLAIMGSAIYTFFWFSH